MGCARDAIQEALENLTADELKRFKMKLLSVPLSDGYGRIPRGTLLSLDAMDLTDKLVSYYLEGYGAELTATVLRDIGMKELALRLQEVMGQGERTPSMGSIYPPTRTLPSDSFASCSSYSLTRSPCCWGGRLLGLFLTLASGSGGP